MLTYGSVCSGIEAASVAWECLGFKPLWFSEIEHFPCAELAHHWPDIPNHGDMAILADRILNREIPAPDILVGGTPCQAFSVAGLRQSLNDERGNLTLEMVRILNAIDTIRRQDGKQPAILVWENVPGVLSTKDNALGCFLGAIAGEDIPIQPAGKKWTGAGFVSGQKRNIAWRTLDAQFFGVPQRRRRIFLVASAREDISAAKILFEPQSLCWNTEASVSKEAELARTVTTRFGMRGDAFKETYVLTQTGTTVSGNTIYPTSLARKSAKLWLGNQEAFSGDYYVINSNIINKTDNSG
ncbi:Site-specific DNA methylase, partial [Snodgrassella alvi SCGC AB-598-J21]